MITSTSKSKKKTIKKKAAEKQAPHKKKSVTKKVTKKKNVAKKIVSKKPAKKKASSSVKKTGKKKSDKELFLLSLRDVSGKKVHVNPDGLTPLEHIPVIDLDKSPFQPIKLEPVIVTTARTVRSRIAFYMGVFLGAVVVNVLLVTVLTFLSV